jgi:muconate cycloisomerase
VPDDNMRIVQLTASIVRLHLHKEFKHASYARRASDNLMVRCELADGTVGWGEGVPRPYVTHETPEGALAQMGASSLAEQFDRDCDRWDDVIEMCSRYQPVVTDPDARGCGSNANRCAVELSILDAYGRLFGQPVSEVARQWPVAQPVCTQATRVRYSGAVTSGNPGKEAWSAVQMRLYGFRHCKVKVGMPGQDDAQRLRRIRRWIGPRMDIRIDANEAWHAEQLIERIEPLLACRISCLEQPVPHEEVEALADLRTQIPTPLMLDESLTSIRDGQEAIAKGTCDLFNIRLSKCGGFLNSLRLAALAQAAGLGYQLGVHPGESGILSAAGRHFATAVREIRYLEGSYDRHLIKENVTTEDITFGYGGWAPALTAPGLGVTVDQSRVEQMTRQKQQYRLG